MVQATGAAIFMATEKNELSYRYWSRGPVVEPAPSNVPQASVHRAFVHAFWCTVTLTSVASSLFFLQKLTAEELAALEQQTKPANPAASAWNAVRAASCRRRWAVAAGAPFSCTRLHDTVA